MKKFILSLVALALLATASVSNVNNKREYIVAKDSSGKLLCAGELALEQNAVTFSSSTVSIQLKGRDSVVLVDRKVIKTIEVVDYPVADLLDVVWAENGFATDQSAAAVPMAKYDKAADLVKMSCSRDNPLRIPAPKFNNTFIGSDITAEGSATDKSTTSGVKYTKEVRTQYYMANYGAMANPERYQKQLADGFSMELLFRLNQDLPASTLNTATNKYEEPAGKALTDGECKIFSGTQSGGYGILMRKESTGNRFIAFNVVTNKTGTCYVNSEVRPDAGKWYHVVGTYRKGELAVYVNGVKYENVSTAVKKAIETEDIIGPVNVCRWIGIGADPKLSDPEAPNLIKNNGSVWGPAAESAFNGDVVLARIYSDPLDADQVELLYNRSNVEQYNKAITLQPSATVYGKVETSEGPVAGAVVSDGEKCVATNEYGFYQLESKKETGTVFVTVPSGYEPESEGVFPSIYSKLKLAAGLPERVDFKLKKVGDQKDFKILFLGDMHIAARTNDLAQFKNFCTDVKKYLAEHANEKIYGITLGDMTWDVFWESCNYQLSNYVSTVNTNLKPFMIYHCIGNHDHDMKSIANNKAATAQFVKDLAPAWYSFNIGDIHFMVIDNVDCIEYDGVKDRPYIERLYGSQMEWIKNDLAFVDPKAPVYVISHGSLFSQKLDVFNTYKLRTADCDYKPLISMFRGREVHFVNGHLHTSHTALPADVGPKTFNTSTYGYTKVYEHNIPAVCSDWWYSGYYKPGCLISTDGTPSGWAVFNFTGNKSDWRYKAAGMSETIQWRAYDLNNVNFSGVKFTKSSQAVFDQFVKDYVVDSRYDGSRKNQLLINAFLWNSACKIEAATVDGHSLTVTPVAANDPLSIWAMTIPYWDRGVSTVPGTMTKRRFHFFEIDCPDKDVDVVVTMTDGFGRVDRRTIARPLAFDQATYAVKW